MLLLHTVRPLRVTYHYIFSGGTAGDRPLWEVVQAGTQQRVAPAAAAELSALLLLRWPGSYVYTRQQFDELH